MASRYQRNERIEESFVGERVVLYHRDSGKALVLNPAGSRLWRHLQAPQTADDLEAKLRAEYSSLSPEQAAQDIAVYLQELSGHDAIVVQ